MNRGMAFAVIYLDTSRIFDRVSQANLIPKVNSFAITDPLLFCLSSCLTQKSQVIFDRPASYPRPVTAGDLWSNKLVPWWGLNAITCGVSFLQDGDKNSLSYKA